MKFDLQRTIVAVSSGSMPGRRAIVRLTGSLTRSILSQLLQTPNDRALLATKIPKAAHVTCSFALVKSDGTKDAPLSQVPATVYFWPNSRSFTGEISAEIHLIGSMPIVEALVAHICSFGAEPAERGEFTLRSFLAGKMDLIQAEAVLGVIEAEGPSQLQEALSQLGGNLSKPVREMRDQLIELIAHLEAGLDFVEEDIEFISNLELTAQLNTVSQKLIALSTQLNTRDARSRTAQIILVGLPNSGKSSLFNRLAGYDRAIVSPLAGTTRDVITQTVDLQGMNVDLIDTAGIEELNEDSPRAAAQTALTRRLQHADVAVFCVDTSIPIDQAWLASQMQTLVTFGVTVLVVGTKADQPSDLTIPTSARFDRLVSARTGVGIAGLTQHLAEIIASHRLEFRSTALHHIAVRCRQAFAAAIDTIDRAISLTKSGQGEELVAAELRMALDELSAVIGEIHSDDILGEIFSRFCIGK